MYSTSTQKKDWTFRSTEALAEKRRETNQKSLNRFESVIHDEEKVGFLLLEDQLSFLKMVAHKGMMFGDSFRPPLWPSIRWTAFAFYKRFFVMTSPMEYSPKHILFTCYYLASKIDEFYVPIHEFVANLKSGTPEHNTASILALEPEVMRVLNYQLTVHCPYRPFEGHLMEMKRNMLLLNFDIETLRPSATQFLRDALLSDAMLLYAPSQIALAAIKHSLDSNAKSAEVLSDFIMKMLGVGKDYGPSGESRCADGIAAVEMLCARLSEIVECVQSSARHLVTAEDQGVLLQKFLAWGELQQVLEQRMNADPNNKNSKDDIVDSDDE